MKIIGIDPGSEQSAWVVWDGDKIIDMGIEENNLLLNRLKTIEQPNNLRLAIEFPECYGMPVGKTVFETCFWTGKFCGVWNGTFNKVYRTDIKLYLCNSRRAKDPNIRQALIDRFGKCGTKKNPGKLYGVKNDLWSALAVCVFFWNTITKIGE